MGNFDNHGPVWPITRSERFAMLACLAASLALGLMAAFPDRARHFLISVLGGAADAVFGVIAGWLA